MDTYFSVDIEADGPIPGPHNMLSLGCAAFHAGDRKPLATFEINLAPLPGAAPDPNTMAWWAKQDPKVWEHVTRDPVEPGEAMKRFGDWIRSVGGTPVLVVYPSWDSIFVHWYFVRYLGKSPFGIGALDIKSFGFGVLGVDAFKDVSKRNMPKPLFEGAPAHTHQALDDALGQGVLFINMLRYKRSALPR